MYAEKEKFFELIKRGGCELAHLDYKREVSSFVENQRYSLAEMQKTKEKATINGYASLKKDVMGMYNTPDEYGQPFESICKKYQSSYIIFGVDYKENDGFQAYPINHPQITKIVAQHYSTASEKLITFNRIFLDTPNLQNQITSQCTKEIVLHYYVISLTESDINNYTTNNLTWLKQGDYGLLEIIHNNSSGPIFALPVTDKKHGKGAKNEIANIVYIRKQGQSMPVERNSIYAKACYSKFDPQYSKYKDDLETLKNIMQDNCFKILVAGISPSFRSNQENVQTFFRNLYKTNKNLVICICENDECEQLLFAAKELRISLLTNENLECINDEKWKIIYEEIFQQQHCFYIVTKNCISKGINTLLRNILKDNRFPPQLIVFNFFITEPATTIIKKAMEISEMIRKVWDGENDVKQPNKCAFKIPLKDKIHVPDENGIRIPNEDVNTVPNEGVLVVAFISYHGSHLEIAEKFIDRVDENRFLFIVASFDQLNYFFESISDDFETNFHSVTLPGSAGNVRLSEEHVKEMCHFQFFSQSDCERFWQSIQSNEEKKKKLQELCEKFLGGYLIEPELLYQQKSCNKRIYIIRDKADHLCKKVRDTLDYQTIKRHQNIIRLVHEPFAGGSTLARVTSWELCKEYVVIMLRSWPGDNSDILKWIHALYEKCCIPICVLIDTSVVTNVTYHDVKTLSSVLFNDQHYVRCAIIFVTQINSGKQEAPSCGSDDQQQEERFVDNMKKICTSKNVALLNQSCTFVLLNKLNTNELSQIDELCPLQIEKDKIWVHNPWKTLGLRSLLSQTEATYLLGHRLTNSLLILPKQQKHLLLLVSYAYFTYKLPLSSENAAQVLNQTEKEFRTDFKNNADLLGAAKNFLVLHYNDGIIPANSYVSDILGPLSGKVYDVKIMYRRDRRLSVAFFSGIAFNTSHTIIIPAHPAVFVAKNKNEINSNNVHYVGTFGIVDDELMMQTPIVMIARNKNIRCCNAKLIHGVRRVTKPEFLKQLAIIRNID